MEHLKNHGLVADDTGFSAPVGWVIDGEVYCEDCAGDGADDEENGAMFSDSESDRPVTCSTCGILLPSNLTDDGYAYIRGILLSAPADDPWAGAIEQAWSNFANTVMCDDHLAHLQDGDDREWSCGHVRCLNHSEEPKA